MLKVFHEGDKVMVDLCGEDRRLVSVLGQRRFAVVLTPTAADELAGALLENVLRAEREPPELVRGQFWGCQITNRDRLVAMIFSAPLELSGKPEVVPLSAGAARQIAGLLRTNAMMAGCGLRIETLRN